MRILITLAALVIVGCDHAPTAAKLDTAGSECLSGPRVSPGSATLVVGDTLRLVAYPAPAGCGSTVAAPIGTFGWHSSDAATATVDSLTGIVRARAAGSVTIITFPLSNPTVKGAAAITVVAR